MCWLWLAFISLGGYGQVSFASGSAIVSHALFGLFVQGGLAFIMLLGLTWRSKGRAASGRF
jgi:hypothetical protein